ncbi:MAG: PBP1A family penicillin-binding protein [Hyphomicrobium sp.]
MNDWFLKQGGRDQLIDWLGLDSKINSVLAGTWSRIKDYWNAGSSFFARFHLVGWRRLLNEGVSEAVSITTGGLVVLYALALPAFLEFDESRFLTGKFAVKLLDADGNELGKRGILHNDSVPLDEIPDALINATLATEDRRFFEHYGIDFYGTARALMTNIQANDVVQGGSTLTQQLAKNLFLSSERSIDRKIKEAFLSFLLESRYSKREILKLYFDRAYMGGGAFGVEAAAQYYFGKSVREINLAEAALMAGLFKAPAKYAPHVNLPSSRARTSEVLDNLVEAGFYTSGQVHAARMNPAKTIDQTNTASPDWFLDWAFDEVQRLAEGKGQYVLTARTTIDLNLQRKAEETVNAAVAKEGKAMHFGSAAMVVTETDGAVRAIVGGQDYGESQFNRATKAKRQPGSSFKVYVYAAALENGYTPQSSVRDASRSCGNWSPQNYGGSGGSGARMPLWMGLAKSYNTVAAELSFAVGREKVIDMTKRLGVSGVKKTCSMALGDGGVTVIEHVGGFATFANGGKLAKPYAILDITTSKGDVLYSRERDEPPAPQVVSPKVAAQMNFMMNKVVTDGTGTRAGLEFTNVAGKTGTSTGPKDAWFVGFTGKYVAGVWLGNDDNRPMSGGSRGVTGGQFAAPIWHAFMTVAHTDMNIPNIPGLDPHPAQIAEQQRIADVRAAESAAGYGDGIAADGTRTKDGQMSDGTREALKKLTAALRKAGGIAEPVAVTPASNTSTGALPQPADRAPAAGSAPDAAVPSAPLPSAKPPVDQTPSNKAPTAPAKSDRRAGLTNEETPRRGR